jgi:hypothetical protein
MLEMANGHFLKGLRIMGKKKRRRKRPEIRRRRKAGKPDEKSSYDVKAFAGRCSYKKTEA